MWIGLLVGGLGAWVTAQPAIPAPPAPVFAPAPDGLRAAPLPEYVGTRRTRLAALDSRALEFGLRAGGLTLNLFDDVTLTAQLAPSDAPPSTARNSAVWVGDLADVPYGQLVLVTDTLSGAIDLRALVGGTVYTAQTVGAGLVRISDLEAGRGRYDAAGLPLPDFIPYDPTEAERAQTSLRADSGSTIDLLAAYTPAAAQMLGGDLQARLAIEGAVGLANLSYANSGVTFRVRLVGIVPTAYVEQGFNDLSRLQNPSDGFMDELHPLRDALAADLVSLTPGTPVEARNYCGIANLPTVLPAPNAAFSITEAHCINDITLAHELGHVMGKAHDPANASYAVHPYAFGYQDPPTGAGDFGDFVTVMAYSTNPFGTNCPAQYQPGVCPAIAWWSSPLGTFNGKALGVANLSDNARSLNETAAIIANYRVSPDGGSIAMTPNPTLTPRPFPTSAPPTPRELLLNGGFELDADGNAIADGWQMSAGTLLCDTPTNPNLGLDGRCSLSLGVGQFGRQGRTVTGIETGDLLSFGYQARGFRVAGTASLRLVVYYANPTAGANANGQDTLTVTLPNGSFRQSFAVRGTLTAADAVTRVRVVLRHSGNGGRVRLDAVSLTVAP
jgi:hypothetical protein